MRLSGQTATVPERDYGQRENRLAAPRVYAHAVDDSEKQNRHARRPWHSGQTFERRQFSGSGVLFLCSIFCLLKNENPSFEKEGKMAILAMDQDCGRD